LTQQIASTGDLSKNGFAVTSMVIGIVGLVLLLFFPVVFIPFIGWIIAIFIDFAVLVSAVIGFILGLKGRASQNRGMAIAGIVLCSIVLVIYLIPVIMLICVVFFGATFFGSLGLMSM